MDSSPKSNTTKKNGTARFIIAIILSPIFFIFWHFNDPERGFMVMSLSGVFVAVIYVKRDLISKWYFIVTMGMLFAAQLALVIVFRPSTKGFPSIVVLPFAIADLVLVLAIVSAVRNLVDHAQKRRER